MLLQVRVHLGLSEAGRGEKASFPDRFRGAWPSSTLIGNFRPLEPWDSAFLLFKPLGLCYFVMAALANHCITQRLLTFVWRMLRHHPNTGMSVTWWTKTMDDGSRTSPWKFILVRAGVLCCLEIQQAWKVCWGHPAQSSLLGWNLPSSCCVCCLLFQRISPRQTGPLLLGKLHPSPLVCSRKRVNSGVSPVLQGPPWGQDEPGPIALLSSLTSLLRAHTF